MTPLSTYSFSGMQLLFLPGKEARNHCLDFLVPVGRRSQVAGKKDNEFLSGVERGVEVVAAVGIVRCQVSQRGVSGGTD